MSAERSFYERLKSAVEEEQEDLDKDEDLTIFYYHDQGLIQVTHVEHAEPGLVVLMGFDQDGHESTVFAHEQSLALVLQRRPREPGAFQRRVPFAERAQT